MLTGVVLAFAGASSSWAVIDPPQSGVEWHCTSMVQRQWSARVSGGQLTFTPHESGAKIRDLVWAIGKRGQLVGRNHGLAGGSLEWVTDAGRQRRTLLDSKPVAFAHHRGDIFVASDLSDRAAGGGAIYRLRARDTGQWQIEQVLKLDEAPLAGYTRGGSLYLVSVMGVNRLDLRTLQTARLHRNMQWWRLMPSSIVEHRGRWYIGAVRGVIRLTPDTEGYREQWVVPASCKTFAGDCECAS
ncbi:hypothetical protein LVB77_15925 [Lysobacter sp. 5GHs7-4]|uniref:hypothetical protein n=1 Tax=Lysobacter sp. 5GHs7-4 TaxID=2904253 RepID=UPI001E5C694D|nr:hypothetical protein [Lysobacter sp. 5GHs7-4]UHQ22141.1 hypothetical protein LVB77_15925 [Lysobacter sp. 5GHs7-4]